MFTIDSLSVLKMNYPAAELRGIKMNLYLINPGAEHRGILLIKPVTRVRFLLCTVRPLPNVTQSLNLFVFIVFILGTLNFRHFSSLQNSSGSTAIASLSTGPKAVIETLPAENILSDASITSSRVTFSNFFINSS